MIYCATIAREAEGKMEEQSQLPLMERAMMAFVVLAKTQQYILEWEAHLQDCGSSEGRLGSSFPVPSICRPCASSSLWMSVSSPISVHCVQHNLFTNAPQRSRAFQRRSLRCCCFTCHQDKPGRPVSHLRRMKILNWIRS
jgi:hypothetical protein